MKEVLFLIPARITLPFFTKLYSECESAIFTRFKGELRPVLRAVSGNGEQYDADELAKVLRRELKEGHNIHAVVVCPTESKSVGEVLKSEANKHDFFVVALTLPLRGWNDSKLTERCRIPRPSLVVCDSGPAAERLGITAAKEFASLYSRETANLLLVGAHPRRMDSQFRLDSFLKGFLRTLQSEGRQLGQLVKFKSCRWERSNACSQMLDFAVRGFVHDDNLDSPLEKLDVVFAANDEMALGIRDALLRRSRSLPNQVCNISVTTRIFGFDGIPEMRTLLEELDYFVGGTATQNLTLLAQSLATALSQRNLVRRKRIITQVPAKVILSPQATAEDDLAKYPLHVPPYSSSSGLWMSERQATQYRGVEKRSMRKFRDKGDDHTDSFGKLGRDRSLCIWRQPRYRGPYFYLKSTVELAVARSRVKRSK
jgi:hypothetical protein